MKYFEKTAISGAMISKAVANRLKTTKSLTSIGNTQRQLKRMSWNLGYPQTLPGKNYSKNQGLRLGMADASSKWDKTYGEIKKWL